MAAIKNIEDLSIDEINRELNNGAKFVVFEYCISILIMTFKRGTDIYFVKSDESAIKHSIGYTILTLLLGWWGIPWGPIYTIGAMFTNFSGGKDVTDEVLKHLNQNAEG
ncbi:MAG: hypothetical protein QM535_00430 [Limnohabitans sp.]|nr:hypothetical protein [Limnohabitans sp.]